MHKNTFFIFAVMIITSVSITNVSAFTEDFSVAGYEAGWTTNTAFVYNQDSMDGDYSMAKTGTEYSIKYLRRSDVTEQKHLEIDLFHSEAANYGRTTFYFWGINQTYSFAIKASGVNVEFTGTYCPAYTRPDGSWERHKVNWNDTNSLVHWEIFDSSNTSVYDNYCALDEPEPVWEDINSIKLEKPSVGFSVTSKWDRVIADDEIDGIMDYESFGVINWGQSSYNLGDMGAIDADLINPDFDTYGYRTIIYNPDGSVNRAWMFPEGQSSQNTFDISMSQLGTYTVKLQYFTDLFNYYDLASDTATVTYQSASLGSAYFSGNYFNVGDSVYFTSNLTNLNNSLYFYEVAIVRPNGNIYNIHNITANESYLFTANEPGEWQGALVAYPKSNPADASNQIVDYMTVYGTGVSQSWIAFNDTYYTKNSWGKIEYGISDSDFYDSHKVVLYRDGTEVMNRQAIAQTGSFDYYFYESGIYTVTIDRNWWALDWDLTNEEILASDMTTVTNTIEGAYTLGVNPMIINCGQTVYFSADTPNVWNTTTIMIKNGSDVVMKNISGQAGSWKPNQTGQYWVYLIDDSAIQAENHFEVFGTCAGYDQFNPDGSGGIQPKDYPTTDQATSNARLQNNLLYFMGLPIFWGMILFCGILIVAATLKAGKTIPYLAPVIIMFELVIGLLEPYSSYIAVGMAIVLVMYFIANFAIGYQQGSS